jgi:hypothetical protein
MLYITAMNLDGQPIGQVELTMRADGVLLLNGEPADRAQVIGSMVGLIVGRRYVCIYAKDYIAARQLPAA